MANEKKRERFKKVSADRTAKINDLLRLVGNCANRNNYSYTQEEVYDMFSSIEESLEKAKSKYNEFFNEKQQNNFQKSFECQYTWISGFMRNVDRFPHKVAMIETDTGQAWSYKQLNEEINRCANALQKCGVTSGSSVVFQMHNSSAFVFLYVACHKLGAIACPIYMKLSPSETAMILDAVNPCVFIYENNGDTALALTMINQKVPNLVITNFPKHQRNLAGHTTWEQFLQDGAANEPTLGYSLSTYGETTHFYTSGTTGRPKCIPVTSINEILTAHDVMMRFSITPNDVLLNLSSWSHRGGLHCGGPSTMLYCGGTVLIMPYMDEFICLDSIEKYQPTCVTGMPPSFKLLADCQEKHHKNLCSIKKIISIGSPLSGQEYERIYQTLCQHIYNGYGTTETFCNCVFSSGNLYQSGNVGQSSVDDEVKIVSMKNGSVSEVPKDGKTFGEIIIKSMAKSAGYYSSDFLQTKKKYRQGFLYTGDIGTWDEKGCIMVCGRNDDRMIVDGEKIYPYEIEEILNRHAKVYDCMVTSVSDEEWGEAIVAYVVKKDETLSAEELNAFCHESTILSDYKCPKYYRFKKVLPKTVNGKKRYNAARKMAENDLKNGKLLSL